MNKWTFSIALLLCAFITTLLFHWWLSSEHGEVIAYNDFKRLAQNGKVLDAELGERTITANVELSGICARNGAILRHCSQPGQAYFLRTCCSTWILGGT